MFNSAWFTELLNITRAEMKTAAIVSLIIVIGFALRWILMRVVRHFKLALLARAASPEDAKWIDTVGRVLRQVVSIGVVLVILMLVLNQLGVSIAPILGAAGVVGIAVGFGAQSLIKDYFNGFFILLENQIRVGDVVLIADKSGLVEEVTLRRVKLRDYDGSVHYVPNGLITAVTNRSTEYAYALIDISIAYNENVDKTIAVLRRVGEEIRKAPDYSARILDDLEVAGVQSLADSAVVLRSRIKVKPLEQWTVQREFFKLVKEAFEREGIEIPFPHRKVIVQNVGSASASLPAVEHSSRPTS